MNNYSVSVKIGEQLDKTYVYHKPKGDQNERYEMLRDATKDLAYKFVINSPPCREQSLALTRLEEAVFYINAAIARNE